MKIKVQRKKAAGVPKLKWEKRFWDKVARVAEAATLENILQQKTRDGGRLKPNQPSTRLLKAAKGRPQLSLVDEKRRFTKGRKRSWKVVKYLPNGEGIIIGAATAQLKKLVGYVTAKGYVGWLGLHPGATKAVGVLIRQEVKRQFRAAKRRVKL